MVTNLDFPLKIDNEFSNDNDDLANKENDESFPLPPTDLVNDDEDVPVYEESSTSSSSESINDELPVYTDVTSSISTSDHPKFTYNSPPTSLKPSKSTCSMFTDLENQWKITETMTDYQPDPIADRSHRNMRRSLSFNDTIEYIYPSSQEDSMEYQQPLQSAGSNTSLSEAPIDTSRSSAIDFTHAEDSDFSLPELTNETCELNRHVRELMERLQRLLAKPDTQIGDKEHMDICQKIVINGEFRLCVCDTIDALFPQVSWRPRWQRRSKTEPALPARFSGR